jgi:hypothetical protein
VLPIRKVSGELGVLPERLVLMLLEVDVLVYSLMLIEFAWLAYWRLLVVVAQQDLTWCQCSWLGIAASGALRSPQALKLGFPVWLYCRR